MDSLSEKDAKTRSKKIDKDLRKDKKKIGKEVKLLLLGAGESGKSTIAKQMKILHLSGFTDGEREEWIKIIHTNCLGSMVSLILGARKLGITIGNEDAAEAVIAFAGSEEIEDTINHFKQITPDIGEQIKQLWEDKAIQKAYRRRSAFQLNDSAEYFISSVERIVADGFLPSDEDMLKARLRTTSVAETVWVLDSFHFRMVDVGGQRGERRKWLHCFDDITAIIFCVSLNGYDMTIREDNRTNRMHEALKLFDEICRSEWFGDTPIILFLNKRDLFEQKIKHVDLNVCFPDYKGGCEYDAAAKYLRQKFQNVAKKTNKKIFCHITTATNTKNVLTVWGAVREIVLGDVMNKLGIDAWPTFDWFEGIKGEGWKGGRVWTQGGIR